MTKAWRIPWIKSSMNGVWFVSVTVCKPKTFCFAWKTKMNSCDVLILLAAKVVAVSVYKYYPFGGCQYKECPEQVIA